MKNLYVTTNTSSRHMREFRENTKASIHFHDPNLFQGLLLRGKMEVPACQDWRNRIWRDSDNIYYKLDPAEPGCNAMLFTADNGRWYKNFVTRDFLF